MWIQKSYKDEEVGKLYIVPTPIGNLKDMTYRAVDVLQTANIIAAEDTRHTKKLCHVYSIQTPLISYHEHNKREREEELVARAKDGQVIALVSDAGMPAISDPGYDLVKRFTDENIPVIALPGANAALTALVSSSMNTDVFTFIGFLPRKKREREEILRKWKKLESTLIFYESPHRLKEMLSSLLEVLGNRKMALCRELTKQYETIIRGEIEDVLQHIQSEGTRGEYVIVVSGATEEDIEKHEDEKWWASLTVVEHVNKYIEEKNISSKEAIKLTAKDRGLKKRDVYHAYHVNES